MPEARQGKPDARFEEFAVLTFLVRKSLVPGRRREDIEIYCLTLIAPLYLGAAHGIVPEAPMAYTGPLEWIAWGARIVGTADIEPQ
jgi:hypothetical protein